MCKHVRFTFQELYIIIELVLSIKRAINVNKNYFMYHNVVNKKNYIVTIIILNMKETYKIVKSKVYTNHKKQAWRLF